MEEGSIPRSMAHSLTILKLASAFRHSESFLMAGRSLRTPMTAKQSSARNAGADVQCSLGTGLHGIR
eukprot:248049-Hanusia_phi.AAC.4